MGASSEDEGGEPSPSEQAPSQENPTAETSSEIPSGEETEPEVEAVATNSSGGTALPSHGRDDDNRWPGWPGYSVFRLVVPVMKVGSIIGRKGELIKKICEETRSRVRILDAPAGVPDRIVLVSGKEEPELELSPAMDGVLRVFKRVHGLSEDGAATSSSTCSTRLLVASSQAINLIGKHGASIKAIQESSGAIVRVLSGEELPSFATADERVVEIQGETARVLKALESVVDHLRKFLVDRSVLPLFETSATATQDPPLDAWGDRSHSVHSAQPTSTSSDYPFSMKRESFYVDRDTQFDPKLPQNRMPPYNHDPALSGLHSSSFGRSTGAFVTKVTQTMQIPLQYAEDIIGIEGRNIAFIRRNSGAVLTIKESRTHPNEIIVEIIGTSKEVQMAQQLIQDFISGSSRSSGSLASQSYGGGYRTSSLYYGDYGGGGGGAFRF